MKNVLVTGGAGYIGSPGIKCILESQKTTFFKMSTVTYDYAGTE